MLGSSLPPVVSRKVHALTLKMICRYNYGRQPYDYNSTSYNNTRGRKHYYFNSNDS
jgi:hypothetical protein